MIGQQISQYQILQKLGQGANMIADSRASLGLAIGLAVLIFAGCGGDRSGSTADASKFTILVPWGDEWVLSPTRRGSSSFLVFLPLATPNERGELEGRLATSWEHPPDTREWTIHLRTDVRWHDGVPVTAHDIKFTVDLFKRPEVMTSTTNTGFRQIESVEVLDDSTFIMTYAPGSIWHTYWYPGYWHVFYPKHLLEGLDPANISGWEFWTRPVGNGPFRYTRHVPKTMMEFEANPDFYRGKPRIDRVVLKFAPESITELLAGNVDAMNLENQIAVLGIKDDPRFKIYYQAWDDISAMLSIIYNHRNPLFGEAGVRRAIAHAIDRHELPRALNMWDGLPVVDVPFTEPQYWEGELPQPLPYDQVLARRLLEQAGWRDENGDGVRERDGEEFRFPMIVAERYQSMAVYVQHKLSQVGIQVEITTLDSSTAWERTYTDRDFETALYYVWITPADVDMGLKVMMGENSAIGFHNPQAAELVNAALEATNLKTLGAIYQELAPIVQEEQPFTFLAFGVETYVAHRRVKGLSTPFRASPLRSAGRLWIEDEY
jgi:peptide/nickel transport system substrate-binding protein